MPKNQIPHLNLANGLDQSGKPHTVADGKWLDSLNFRHRAGFITQIPRRILVGKTAFGTNKRVTAIRVLPIKHFNRVRVIIWCGGRVYRLSVDGKTPKVLGGDNSFNSGGPYSRWATAVHGDYYYFTNRNSPIAYTDGCTVTKLSGSVPGAKYITMFYDHLIAANVISNGVSMPSRLMWSDINKIGTWVPARSNEADFHDCLESATDTDAVGGLTGLQRMGDFCVAYTPSVLFKMQYVGLPRVFLTTPWISGVGNDLAYGMAGIESVHFFISLKLQNFFQLDGNGPKAIGDDIISFFMSDLSTDPFDQQMTWAYIDEANNEVAWVYISKSGNGSYDRRVHYNFVEKTWFRSSVEDLSAFGGFGYVYSTVDDMTGVTCDTLANSCDQLDLSSKHQIPRTWGGNRGEIYNEAVGNVAIDKSNSYAQPYLETGDMLYDSPATVKESESMLIDATAVSGFTLEVSARDFIQDAVVYTAAPQTWLSTLPEKRLSYPHVAGRIIRYRFKPVITSLTQNVKRAALHVEIATQKYTNYQVTYDSTFPPNGLWMAPVNGNYSVVLIGAGGGGGVDASTSNWQSYNTYVEDATHKRLRPTKLTRYYDEFVSFAILNIYLRDFGLATTYGPIYFPGGTTDPHLLLSQAQIDKIYQAALDWFAASVNGAGVRNAICNIYFIQQNPLATGSANGFLYSTWLAGDKTATVIPNPAWFVMIDFGGQEHGEQYGTNEYLKYAGGGGGSYARLNLAAGAQQTVFWQRGQGGNHVISGFSTKGANGGDTFARLNVALGTDLVTAGGGTGGGNSGAGYVSGVGGTVSNGGLTNFTINSSASGENATAEALPIMAKGGRGYSSLGVLQASSRPNGKGQGYGGGGCGRQRDYRTNLIGTKGADGLVWIGWRIGPDGLAYPYPGLGIANNIEKSADKQISTQTINLSGTSASVNIQFWLKAVVEENGYTGGSSLGGDLYLGGATTAGNRMILKLVVNGATTYFLNRSVSPQTCCKLLNYVFVLNIPGNSSLVLTMDNQDSKQYEPRDSSGLPIDTSEGSDLYEPQWATLEVYDDQSVSNNTLSEQLTEFVGFTENIYGGGAEK